MDAWLLNIWNQLPQGPTFLAAAFVVAYLESLVAIGLLVPGSTLIVVSGFLAFHGKADMVGLICWSALGAFLGDMTSYWLGARFGPRIWKARLLRRRREMLRKAEILFIQHGAKSIFFGRFLGPIRGQVPFVCGLSRMKARFFVGYGLLSAMLWGLCYPGLGYLGGSSWQRAQTWASRFALLMGLLLAATVVVVWLRWYFLGSFKKSETRDAGRGTRKP